MCERVPKRKVKNRNELTKIYWRSASSPALTWLHLLLVLRLVSCATVLRAADRDDSNLGLVLLVL